jgi:hypothetical protein
VVITKLHGSLSHHVPMFTGFVAEMCYGFGGTCVFLCVLSLLVLGFWYYDNARVFVMRIDIGTHYWCGQIMSCSNNMNSSVIWWSPPSMMATRRKFSLKSMWKRIPATPKEKVIRYSGAMG